MSRRHETDSVTGSVLNCPNDHLVDFDGNVVRCDSPIDYDIPRGTPMETDPTQVDADQPYCGKCFTYHRGECA